MCCNCRNHTTIGQGDGMDVVVAFAAGIAAIAKGAWWVTTRLIGPAVALTSVTAYRWLSGLPLLPDQTRPARYTRPVRAAARVTVTVLAAAMLADPWVTLVTTDVLLLAGTTTVVLVRRRNRLLTGPRRVPVTVGTPVREPEPAPPRAVTGHTSGTTWTEQAVRNLGRAA